MSTALENLYIWLLRSIPILFTLTSCSYHFGHGELSQRYTTISVPYVEGDLRGELTTFVIKRLSLSGSFRYVNGAGDLLLKIKMVECRDDHIGFRYDRNKRGKLKKSLVPTETRLSQVAEVCLIENGTGKTTFLDFIKDNAL